MSENSIARKKFDEGMSDFVNHNYEQSIEHLSRAIKLDPSFILAIKSRGAAYLRLDNVEAAITDFSSVIEMAPKNARAYHLRGLAFEKIGKHDKALDDFNSALALKPNYGAVYYSRANLNHKMGRAKQATEDIRMATNLTEVNIETFSNANNVWRSQQLRLESVYNDDPAL